MTNDITELLLCDSQTTMDDIQEASLVDIVVIDKDLKISKKTVSKKADYPKASPLWNFFSKLNKNRAKCEFCDNEFSWKSTITNLAKHLARKHPIVYRNFQNNKKRMKNNHKDSKLDRLTSQKLAGNQCMKKRKIVKIGSNLRPLQPKLSEDDSDMEVQEVSGTTPSASEEESSSAEEETQTVNERNTAPEKISNETRKASEQAVNEQTSLKGVPEESESIETKGPSVSIFDEVKKIIGRRNLLESTNTKETVPLNDKMESTNKTPFGKKKHRQKVSMSTEMKLIMENQKSFENTLQILNSNLTNMTNAVLNLCKVGEKIAESMSQSHSCGKCECKSSSSND